VDVAVFIFGQNKKLYEYTSGDMRELMVRYNYVSSRLCASLDDNLANHITS